MQHARQDLRRFHWGDSRRNGERPSLLWVLLATLLRASSKCAPQSSHVRDTNAASFRIQRTLVLASPGLLGPAPPGYPGRQTGVLGIQVLQCPAPHPLPFDENEWCFSRGPDYVKPFGKPYPRFRTCLARAGPVPPRRRPAELLRSSMALRWHASRQCPWRFRLGVTKVPATTPVLRMAHSPPPRGD